MARKDALRLRAVDTFASAGLKTLYTDFVEREMIYCLEQITWEIDTVLSGGNDRVRLWIAGHGYKIPLEQQSTPTADKLYTYSEKAYLYPGERLALDLDEAQADTIAEMHGVGYWEGIKR